MGTRWVSICGLVIFVSSMTGCADGGNYLEPYDKPYTWYPTGAPAANLAAQLVNPRDLVIGRGAPEGDAKESSLAIERIWQDKPKPITETSSTGAGGGGASGSGGGSGSGSGGASGSGGTN